SLPSVGSGLDGLMHKIRDTLRKERWLVLWNKGTRLGDVLQRCVRKGLLKTLGNAGREKEIVFSPHNQDWVLELWEGTSCFERVPIRNCLQNPREIAPDPCIGMHRREVAIKDGRIGVTIGNARHQQALGETRPEQPYQEVRKMCPKELCPVVK